MARYKQSTGQFVSVANMPDLSRDLKQLKTAFDRLPEKVAKKALRSAVTKATSAFRSQAKAAIPVKTGRLKSGFTRSTKFASKKSRGGFFKVRIGWDRKKAPHALLYEEGTKARFTKGGLIVGAYRGRMPAGYAYKKRVDAAAPGIARAMAVEIRNGLEKVARETFPNTR